ncbi:MAG: hypothetical protein IMW98_07495 [Firmicutes bacterium]|nr:hypothetical protein [Bacillota bacterium]
MSYPLDERLAPLAPLRTFLQLFASAQGLFWLAWWAGYAWLPEGVLRGRMLPAALPLERLDTAGRVVAVLGWNVLAAAVFVAGANRLRVRRLPLGFVPPLVYWGLYGQLLGTNSFVPPLPERPAPSLATILARSGFMELTAYVLVAAATAGWSRWCQESWLGGPVRRLDPRPLRAPEYTMLAVAGVLLAAAALREVSQWCGASGGC